jgi:hypothetical protein
MAAGLGFKTFTTGEVLTAGDVNGYLMQGVLVFASAAARDAAITAPQEGQFAFTKDTNGLWYYDGAVWVASGATGDIEGVTAGVGISGGGTSGTVTITNSMATAIDAKGDLVAGTGADTFSRIAVGANDTVLTADSSTATGLKWASAAAGGMTLISTTALTGASTITISSIPTTGYKDLRLVLVNAVMTNDGGQIRCRPNNVSTTANYLTNYTLLTGTGNDSDGSDTLMYLQTTVDNVVVENLSVMHIYNYAETTRKIMQVQYVGVCSNPTTNFAYINNTIFGKDPAAISSITLISTGGNFNGGNAYVYGVN